MTWISHAGSKWPVEWNTSPCQKPNVTGLWEKLSFDSEKNTLPISLWPVSAFSTTTASGESFAWFSTGFSTNSYSRRSAEGVPPMGFFLDHHWQNTESIIFLEILPAKHLTILCHITHLFLCKWVFFLKPMREWVNNVSLVNMPCWRNGNQCPQSDSTRWHAVDALLWVVLKKMVQQHIKQCSAGVSCCLGALLNQCVTTNLHTGHSANENHNVVTNKQHSSIGSSWKTDQPCKKFCPQWFCLCGAKTEFGHHQLRSQSWMGLPHLNLL